MRRHAPRWATAARTHAHSPALSKVRGLQFVIADCRNCDIFLVDRVGTLTVDACAGCRIFVGPCEGSVFVRDCQDCQVVCLAQQFRTRDCKRCDIRLFCQTEPVIESSKNLRFGCVDMSYFGMAGAVHGARW